MQINIVHGNHFNIKYIKDIIKIIYDSFIRSKYVSSIKLTNEVIPNQVNFIIEEFSNKVFCENLLKIKYNYPDTILFCLITEIPTNNTYNAFASDDIKKIEELTNDLNILNPSYGININNQSNNSFINSIIKNNHFFKNELLKTKGPFINYGHLVKNNYIKGVNKIGRKFFNGKNLIYNFLYYSDDIKQFFCRFHNTKILINNNIFSQVFIINESSKDITDAIFNTNSVELPYFVELLPEVKKSCEMSFSGTKTGDRIKIFNKLEGLGLTVEVNTSFNDTYRDIYTRRSMFSLHISRFLEGNYSSPTRVLYALQNGAIPIAYTRGIESSFEKN
jgi:hypothetical protein